MTDPVKASADIIARKLGRAFPKTVIVLGSGLGAFAEALDVDAVISYADLPAFPQPTVHGHAGRLVIGALDGVPLAVMQGRMHVYEGHDVRALAIPIRTYRSLGAETLILTNAAGSLNPVYGPGSLVMIDDHINFSGRNPLIGANDEAVGLRFPDMSAAYDPDLKARLLAAARRADVALGRGVYLMTTGPNFETPAEIRAFRVLGADLVGMSTVPEVLVAHHCGLKVVGVSVVSNLAAGLSGGAITHEETLAEGAKAADAFMRLLTAFIADLRGA
ncbi:MAG: purine-nucleoside phosphorylase [Pseudomonadota bacterium]